MVDYRACVGKYKSFVTETNDSEAVDNATKVLKKLIAMRFHGQFFSLWQATVGKPTKRYDSLDRLNTWLTENSAHLQVVAVFVIGSRQKKVCTRTLIFSIEPMNRPAYVVIGPIGTPSGSVCRQQG